MNAMRVALIFVVNILFLHSLAKAALITVPSEYSVAEAPGANYFPFSSGTASMLYQQLYYASEFSDISQPTAISELRFRPDESQGPFSQTIPNVTISLSATNEDLESSTRYYSAANHGPNRLVVYSGPLTLETQSLENESGIKEFSVSIVLQTPFVYDPAQGNLLLDIEIPEPIDRIFLLDYVSNFPDASNGTRRIYATGGAIANQAGNGLITQFVVIPEPTAYSLAIAAFCLMIGRRQTARRARSSRRIFVN